MFCRQCGESINENQAVCIKCGTNVGEGNRFCANCGNEVPAEASVCLNCGCAITKKASGDLGDKKTTAGILALLLGGFGIHNFYLGESKKGILKILIAWTGISGILALIDAVKIFTDKYEVNPDKWI